MNEIVREEARRLIDRLRERNAEVTRATGVPSRLTERDYEEAEREVVEALTRRLVTTPSVRR